MSTLNGGPGNIVTNGLVLYLDAANANSYTSGSAVWRDLTYFNNSGSLINGPLYSPANGGNIRFDGTNDYATLNPSLIPTGNEITIGVWNYGLVAKTSSIISCFKNPIGVQTRTINIHLPWSDSSVYWDCGYGTGADDWDRISASVVASEWQNSWHYWAFTKNAITGIMRMYVDGILKTQGVGKTQTIPTSDFSNLARYSPTPAYHQGYISNFHIYNRALSAQEILQNYNSTKARFGL